MTRSKCSIRVPGKQFLSGEYAILEPNAKALVLALERYLYVDLVPSESFNIRSSKWPGINLAFDYINHSIIWKTSFKEELSFIQQALLIALEYLSQQSIEITPFTLAIRSELASNSIKLGLGSSAALSVGIVASLCHSFGLNIASPEIKLIIFKLAFISHWSVQQGGSGADIAACTFGGVVFYSKADPIILDDLSALSSIVQRPWKYLDIQSLNWPAKSPLNIGWTGVAASTVGFIDHFLKWRESAPKAYQQFVQQTSQVVLALKAAIVDQDTYTLIQLIRKNRSILRTLASQLNLNLENHGLKKMCDVVESLGGAAKFSGAGGGDCGIAILPESIDINELKEQWKRVDIQLFSLNIDQAGVQKSP